MKGLKTGGRKKGSVNKTTSDIKDILNRMVDWDIVVGKLLELVEGVEIQKQVGKEVVIYSQPPDSGAAKILLEYGFGKPKQTMDLKVEEFVPPQIILDGTATDKTE